jgi:hypothetical protein
MATQALTPAVHPVESTLVTSGMTTLASTGAGNGFTFNYKDGYLVYLYNPTGGNATVTFKVAQGSLYSDRTITIPDETATIATTEVDTWKPESIFNDGGTVTIECDVLIQAKVISQITRSA